TQQRSKKEWLSVMPATNNGEFEKTAPILDLSWIPEAWWRWISPKKKKGKTPEEMNRRHFEVCVFSRVALELKAGDLYIAGSEKYADYRKQLITWEEYEEKQTAFCHQVNLPASGYAFRRKTQQALQQVSRETDQAIPKHEQVKIDK